MPIEFSSDVWDDAKQAQIISNGLTRIAKRFRRRTETGMIDGPQTGRVYRRGGGAGFRRAHRASARGQRPAIDTGNLLAAVEDVKTSPTTHEVGVDDAKAAYGKWLQNPQGLDRPIATKADADAFAEGEMQEEVQRMKGEMVADRGGK